MNGNGSSVMVEGQTRSRSSSPAKPSVDSHSKRITRSSTGTNNPSTSTASSSSPKPRSTSSLQSKLRSSNLKKPSPEPSTSTSKFRLPLKLPQLSLTPITNPYLDLEGHLNYHGLNLLAEEMEEAKIPVDYACSAFFATASGGPIGLLDRTTALFYPHETETRSQLSSVPEGGLPDRLELNLPSEINGNQTPSHILAVCSSTSDVNSGLLLPIHSLPYALQCISLPSLSGSISASEDSLASSKQKTGLTTLPIIPLRVPKPEAFPTTHTYLYTRDPASLLAAVIPMSVITRHWNSLRRNTPPNELPTPSEAAIEALAQQASKELLKHAKDIHSVWANGVAIGLVNGGYWETLDKAWNIIIGALILKKEKSLREDIIQAGEKLEKTLMA